jgi:hypothetical protein
MIGAIELSAFVQKTWNLPQQACKLGRRGQIGLLAEYRMPIFMDRHDVWETTAADVAEAHRRDLEVQDR